MITKIGANFFIGVIVATKAPEKILKRLFYLTAACNLKSYCYNHVNIEFFNLNC